jgi:IS5 family transposase
LSVRERSLATPTTATFWLNSSNKPQSCYRHLADAPRVKTVLTDLGFRGVDAQVAPVQLMHCGKLNRLSQAQRRCLKRRQAIEPIIGHLKQDHGMRRCWLKGVTGDAVHAVLCSTGYNLRWLLRAITRLGIKPAFFVLGWLRSLWRCATTCSVSLPSHGYCHLNFEF